ncbi:KH domain-containing protein [candidate division WOR-3 bacterium]|uniref:RNA-binding protein KhpA n=1 Tax=candidate division WOR-3 bacterium TaxID=2052148 RepID=A0A9D5QD65_UNCW3|nr:KH domain-containing protein [candidate division WOR-3 bacterium]MBD3363765.1 KH domain-containing protein [candidate division WOR-3 bacterium]
MMKDLLEYMVKSLVDNPDNVMIDEIAGEKTIIYELRVGEGDLGKVIGKEGRMAKAIRTILTAASMKKGKRAQLEIIE